MRPSHRKHRLTRPALVSIALAWILVAAPVVAGLSVARGSASGVAVVQAGADQEWRYRVQPGESLRKIATDLLKQETGVHLLAAHNGVRVDHSPAAGEVLRIPVRWLRQRPEPAALTSASGEGQVRFSSGQQEPMRDGLQLRVGDELITHQGEATVTLADGSLIRLSPRSRLRFSQLARFEREDMFATRLRLDRGELSTEVTPLKNENARFEIETPWAVAAVRGTAFDLAADGSGTELRVTEGAVAFGEPGSYRRIPAGYTASAGPEYRDSVEIRKLPPAPEPDPLPLIVNRLPQALSWTANDAPAHELTVIDMDSGRRVLQERSNRDNFQLEGLDNGRYRLQLASLSRGGVAGMPSTQAIEIDLTAQAAILKSPQTDEEVGDNRPEFSWDYRGDNERGRLEIAASEAFDRTLYTSDWSRENRLQPARTLDPGTYYWRVVTEAGGNSVARSEARPFIVQGSLPPVRIININYIDSQVRIFWQSVDTVDEYRLQLSEDPGFDNIIKEASVSDTTAALRLIPGRRYFVRLQALSDGPLSSRWGPERELFIE